MQILGMSVTPELSKFAKKFRSIVDSGKCFLVLTHVRPDGDAYGSLLAVAHALKNLGKEVVLWSEDPVADRYQFLPGTEWIQCGKPPEGKFDARILVDNANQERAGKIDLPPDPKSPIINIDHHASNPNYGDLAYVEPNRASCGEVIFDLFKEAQIPMTPEIARCLFVAISTDTGSFQYPAVTPSTFRIAAELLEQGIDLGEISRQTYESNPPRRLLLLKEVLQSAKFEANDRIGYFWMDAASFQKSGAKPEDSEGMIDHIRSIRSVLVAVLFEEIPAKGEIRMSFRSKDKRVDVNKIAQQFNGGGHPAAAGARIKGTREEIQARVLEAIRTQLPQ
jgi:bifunctional oligoribonuclease and PAP phosphatase NrnA